MAQFGYDKELFPNLTGDMFDCPICLNVVRRPKECSGCGDMFCGKCIDDWIRKSNTCPKRCPGNKIQPMTSPALIKIYEALDMKCLTCKRTITLGNYEAHKTSCGRPKCWNTDICQGFEDAKFEKSCSEMCQIFKKIVATGGNPKQMYEILRKFQPKQDPVGKPGNSNGPVSSSSTGLKWNSSQCGQGLNYEKSQQLVMLKESAYVFRTAVAEQGFTSGQHYWEIIPDVRTENELKIGVTTTLSFDFNTAFCDHVFGFAYYGLGQLRHSSNASGPQYGKRLKKQGVLGVFLNMDRGQLSFSLNGENMGVAFENMALKKGPIYPAVALLHCAGCTIRGELPVPHIFK